MSGEEEEEGWQQSVSQSVSSANLSDPSTLMSSLFGIHSLFVHPSCVKWGLVSSLSRSVS